MAGRFITCMILLTSAHTEEYDYQNKWFISYFGKHNDSRFNNNTSLNTSKSLENEYIKNIDARKTDIVNNTTPNKDRMQSENNNDAKHIKFIEEVSENQETSTINNSESTKSINGTDTSKLDANVYEKNTNKILNSKLITYNENNEKNLSKTQEILDKEDINTASSQIYTSYSKPTYQVHENVIDIPDDRRPVGPIIANYTKKPNFNTIIPTEKTTFTTARSKSRRNNKNINKHDDLLDFEIVYDDTKNFNKNKCKNKVNYFFKGIKDYFSGLHKDFVNGFHNLFKQN